MAVFQREEVVKANELERDINGLIQRDSRKKLYKDRSAKIEHYSLLLKDEKINVKRFLKIMAHIDNKIVFAENEFPVLDADEIEFDDSRDKDLYTDIVKNLNGNASVQANDETPTTSTAPIVTSKDSSDTLEQPQSQPPVLTRSKARKAMKHREEKEPTESSTALTNENRKRRVEESKKTQHENRSKRAKVIK